MRQFGIIGARRLIKAARYYSGSELQYLHSENYQNHPEFGDYGKAPRTDDFYPSFDSPKSRDHRLNATVLHGLYRKTLDGDYYSMNARKEKPMKNRGSFEQEDQMWGYN